jgi:myo-inositol 2-dehydrogenase/D-chiro-inositol 1-dehydrogenase/scyllo-inositol 2-dehydrogenase (NAD+)
MNKIRVCVIGLGRAGMIHARNFATAGPEAELAAIVDPNPEALQNALKEIHSEKCFTQWQEVLLEKDLDAVVVATPTDLHKEIVVAAAQSGKHILCEKPMALNSRECDLMIEAVERNRVRLQLGFMRRYDRNFLEAKERIAKGEIGDVVLVKSLTHGPSIPKAWQYDLARSNGPLAEVNSHDIDTLRWFTESEFKTVYAIGGNYRCPEARQDYPDFYDNVVLTACFENGKQGLIGGAAAVRYGYDSRVEILGTDGILFIGSLDASSVVSCNPRQGSVKSIVPSWRDLFMEAYLTEDKDFIRCILNNDIPQATGFDGKKAVEVVNAGNRSILERRPIELLN